MLDQIGDEIITGRPGRYWHRLDDGGSDPGADDGLDALRAACSAAWAAQDAGSPVQGTTGEVPEVCADLF